MINGLEQILIDMIIVETVKEFKVPARHTVALHTAIMILTETYLSVGEAAGKMDLKEVEAIDLAMVANNAFLRSKQYRRKIYRVICNVHDRASFSRPKSRNIFGPGDLPGLKTSMQKFR